MASNTCLLALQQCHHYYRLRSNVIDDATDNTNIQRLASRIAQEAEKQLPQDVYDALVCFLRKPIATHDNDHTLLQDKLARRHKTFVEEETALSGEAQGGLATYSGPPNADLGLILHIQSEDGNIGEFWNTHSATIRLLHEKGIDPARVFCYDWHWRGESTFHGGKRCPMTLKPKSLRDLHDELSTDILELLELPFLVTASSCVRDTYRKKLSGSLFSFDIELVPGSGVLKFDLEYTHRKVRRMTLHTHHPTAAFFADGPRRSAFGLQIDMGFSFMLWLTGQSSDIDRFRREYALIRPPSTRSAPIPELWKYRALESALGRNLKLDEMNLPLTGWIARYLQQDLITASGDGVMSLIQMVVDKITHKIRVTPSESIKRKRSQDHNAVLSAGKSKRTAKKQILGEVTGKTQAVDTQYLTSDRMSPCPSGNTSPVGGLQIQPSAGTPIFGFTSPQRSEQTYIEISSDDDEPAKRTCPDSTLEETDSSPQRSRQPCVEISSDDDEPTEPTYPDSIPEETDSFINVLENDCITHDLGITIPEPIPWNPRCLSDARIPIPFDDQLEEETSGQSATKYKGVTNSSTDLESMAGTRVRFIVSQGRVRLPDNGLRLTFRMGRPKAAEIAAHQTRVKLWFTRDAIELRIEDETVYIKSFERLLATTTGLEWLCQISHELKLLGNGLGVDILSDRPESTRLKVGKPLTRNSGTVWRAAELRRRLLHGDNFHTAKFNNGTDCGRVFFRDVQLIIPEEADFNTVFVKCDLAPEGSRHSNCCCRNAQDDDPATRLGIQVRFDHKAADRSSTIWTEFRGENDLKKVNSLVDFLEERDDQWTESQPRRFLARNKNRGRDKISYTS